MQKAATIVLIIVIYGTLQLFGTNMYLFALLQLPGTIAHELCHYLFAWVLGGDPFGFTVFPVREGGGWKLGSVRFHGNWYNVSTVAMAPFLMLPAAVTTARIAMVTKTSIPIWVLLCYLSVTFFEIATPSGQDFSLVLGSPSSWPAAILILGGISWGWWKLFHLHMRRS